MTTARSRTWYGHSRRSPRAVAIWLGVGLLAGCSSTATAHTPRTVTAPAIAPLDTSLSTATGTWALLAMGYLDQPDNTFWEAFYHPRGGTQWSLRTPPGVADNGGLVAAVTGTRVTFGFRPSDSLRFSPLAFSADDGRSYSPGLLPAGLGDVPDALSMSASRAVALVGTQVIASRPAMSAWHPLTSLATLQKSSAGQRCGLQQLTAVAVTGSGVAIGADCSHGGVAGVFTASGSTLQAAGPVLGSAAASSAVRVVRLIPYRHGLAALLAIPTSGGAAYEPAWQPTPSGPWTVGRAAAAGPLVSASVTSEGGFTILTGPSAGRLAASYVEPTTPHWVRLADPPLHTSTVSKAGSRIDAIAVNDNTFVDYKLSSGQWFASQTIKVPVPIGSSS